MTLFPRATLKCLKEDLKLTPPVAGEGLISDLQHPLLDEIKRLWLSETEFKKDRILSLEDNIFFKVKPNIGFRGILWEEDSNRDKPWLVAAGKREDGSKKDIYEKVFQKSKLEAKSNNSHSSKKTDSNYLKPNEEDKARLVYDTENQSRVELMQAIKKALETARRNLSQITVFNIGPVSGELKISRENDIGEIFLTILITSDNPSILSAILKMIRPDLNSSDWQIEYEPSIKFLKHPEFPVFSCYTLWEAPWDSLGSK